jgi:hypothetical protein
VSDSRESAVEDLQRLIEGAEALGADLRTKEASYRQAIQCLEQGKAVSTALEAAGADQARVEMTRALDEFEQLRHRSRLSLITAGLDEGMTIGQFGRAWGFSRQLAARYVKEARHR